MARDTWFETVAFAQERAKKRLPKSVYAALLACVAALPVPGDKGLPPCGQAIDPLARGDVEPSSVVVCEADDVTEAGDGDSALARAQVDAHDTIQLSVRDEEVVPGVVVRERPGLHDLDGPRLALGVRGGDAHRDHQQESQHKGP